MIYTCASPVGVDLRDKKMAEEHLKIWSLFLFSGDSTNGRGRCPAFSLSPPTFVSTSDCSWNADILMAQQCELRSAASSCSSVVGFKNEFLLFLSDLGLSLTIWTDAAESCTRIWVIIMKPRHTNTSWKENRSLFKCILRCSHHLSLCPLAVFGCSETQNVSFSCEWFCFWCYYSHICSLFNGEIQSRHVADNNWVCQHVKI